MSEAVIVQNATKMFGCASRPALRRLAEHSAGKANGHLETITAVDQVSFRVQPGEIFGIVGPVGSGKSTLMRMLAALLPPDSGEIRIFGYDVVRYAMQVQRLINRVSVEASFFRRLSPLENLLNGGRLYIAHGSELRRQAVQILTRLGLEESAIYQPMEQMSRGQQQKVSIAQALLSRTRLLLLDDLTSGLDSFARQAVVEMLCELRSQHGTTILLATRTPQDAAAVCDRLAVLDYGRLVALDTPQGLQNAFPAGEQEFGLEHLFLNLIGQKLVEGTR